MTHRTWSAVFVAVGVLAVSGCANDAQDVRSVARTFIDASERGDTATAQSVTTRKAQEFFASNATSNPQSGKGDSSYRVGDPVIRENEATVPVTTTDESGTSEVKIKLRREENKWRVYAMQMPTLPGAPSITLDYENPMSILPQGMHAAGFIMGQAAKGFEQGAKEFAQGFERGYGQTNFPSASPSPTVKIEEVPSPEPQH